MLYYISKGVYYLMSLFSLFPIIISIFFIIIIIVIIVASIKQTTKKNTSSTTPHTKKWTDEQYIRRSHTSTDFSATTYQGGGESKQGNIISGIFLIFFTIVWTSILLFMVTMLFKSNQLSFPLILFFIPFFLVIIILIIQIIRTFKGGKQEKISDTPLYEEPIEDSYLVLFCPGCGESLEKTDRFCPSCGRKIK